MRIEEALHKYLLDKQLTTTNYNDGCAISATKTVDHSRIDINASNLIIKNLSTAVDSKTLGRIFSRLGRVASHKVKLNFIIVC